MPNAIRPNVAQRLEFIEQQLFWSGQFNKSDLMERFGISVPQTSVDVAKYQRLAPGNMTYDASERTFLPSASFEPRFMRPDARAYLSQLLLLADGAMEEGHSWIGEVPAHAAIPKVRRRLDAETLRSIVLGIRRKRALEVVYQSFSATEPTTRWVAPHGLAFDGFRWHARVWCYKRSGFIDLVLARLLKIGASRPAEIDGRLDRAWNEWITVRLGPNPELSEAHRRVIELDYGMENGEVGVPIRLALYYYFERHLCLDIDAPPDRKQVVVLNLAEIESVRSGLSGSAD